MRIDNLKKYIPQDFVKKFKDEGIHTLYPAQEEAIKEGLFENKNLVISTPTASGKTLIATLAIINRLKAQGEKIVYIVPLVALASEKYQYYKEFFKGFLRVAISVGDFDSSDPWLKEYQLIIATCEKLDSLIRHGAEWVNQVSLIIADEIHLLGDSSRGPTLEILLTILRKKLAHAQFLGLSATVSNDEQISKWVSGGLIKSDFRPVRLYEGACFNSHVKFLEKKSLKLTALGDEGIVRDTVHKLKKQLLIFVSTRRSSESLAERAAKFMTRHLKGDELEQLDKISRDALNQLETPSRQCRRLALVLKKGAAFHHAGLLAGQKSLIEEGFRKGIIKVICATPTLAMGVNLPAFRVLVRDTKRYYAGSGSLEIPVLEYKQFAGRAGRPEYDRFGEAILMAPSAEEAQRLLEKYALGVPEDVESKLAQDSSLRIHSLSLIAAGICISFSSLLEFYSLSFFGFQYKDINLIEEKLKRILKELEVFGFIEAQKERLVATTLGRRVSQLYIDPLSAHNFVLALEEAEKLGFSDFGVSQLISYVDEMQPLLRVRERDMLMLNEIISQRREFILMDIPLLWDENYEHFLKSVKTALCLNAWIEEHGEDELLEQFQITPGELHNKLEIAEWLTYCLIEISLVLKKKQFTPVFRRLRIRLNYGVKEELLDLVSLRQIGRIRARRLFNAGIKDVRSLKSTPRNRLARILGPRVGDRVIEQVT